jgi:Ca-activated chloride channel family protein
LLIVLAPLPRAHAFEWQDLWQRPDQRGLEAFETQQADRAAELFENPEWRSAAQYRAGQFEASAGSLANIDSAAGPYNRGNALAKAGQLPAAIGAYDRALELDPSDEDARYNRDVVQQFLQDNPEQQQPQDQGQGEQGQQGDSDQSQGQSGEPQDGSEAADEQQSEQGEQGESGESQANDGAQDPTEEPNDGEPQGEENAEQDANAGEESAEEATASAAGPEEVEQWASEQAAEQWLRRVPQDPGGLLRRKFLYQYQRLGVDQNGNRVLEGPAAERRPW